MKWNDLTIREPKLPAYDKFVLLCYHHVNYNTFDNGYDDVYIGVRKYTDTGGEHYFSEESAEIKGEVTKWAEIEGVNIHDPGWNI